MGRFLLPLNQVRGEMMRGTVSGTDIAEFHLAAVLPCGVGPTGRLVTVRALSSAPCGAAARGRQ